MVYIPKEVMDLLKPGETQKQVVKVLATADDKGVPHAIILGPLMAIDEETLAFGIIWASTTKKNLETTKNACIIVYKPPMTACRVHGTFEEYVTSGPLFDRYTDELKKWDLECAGVIKIKVTDVCSASGGKRWGEDSYSSKSVPLYST